ncbi:hypothetical protein [Zavarzinella formosa]|uniref:hypothetical protein n=1 Tax=Zavarzinella formosa TaxID=360055 RepID=UPI000317AD4B|nr:hypothetical protein [Zavarzinella formosa]
MAQLWFDVLEPGTLQTPGDLPGKVRVTRITARDRDNAAAVGNAKLAAGWQIPVCWDHQDVGPVRLSRDDRAARLVKNTLGYLKRFAVQRGKLRALADIPDAADAAQAAKVRHTSPCLDWNWRDADGVLWPGCTVQHLAITNRPVQRRLNADPPLRLSNTFNATPLRVWLSLGEFTPMADDQDDQKNDYQSDADTDTTPDDDDDTDDTDTDTDDSDDADDSDNSGPDAALFQKVLKLLAAKGIKLPAGTTPENGWERLYVALHATSADASPDDDDTDDEDDEEDDAPTDSGPPAVVSKRTSVTPSEESSPLTLSLRRQEMRAENLARKGIAARVTMLVKTGRITPALGSKLTRRATQVRLSFNSQGDLNSNELLTAIRAYEALPRGGTWRPRGKRVRLSNNDVRRVSMPPALKGVDPGDDSPEARKQRLEAFQQTTKRR